MFRAPNTTSRLISCLCMWGQQFVFGSVLMFATIVPCLGWGQTSDPFAGLATCKAQGKTEKVFESSLGRTVVSSELQVARQGDRWSCAHLWQNLAYPNSKTRRFVFTRDGRGGEVIYGSVHGKGPEVAIVSPKVLGDKKESFQFWPFGSYVSGVFFGELVASRIYDDLMMSAKSEVADSGLVRFKGESEQGEFEVVADLLHGGLPTEVFVNKKGRHRIRGQFVRDMSNRSGGGDLWPKKFSIDHIEIRMKVKDFGEADGIPFIKAWKIEQKAFLKNSNVVVTVTETGLLDDLQVVSDLSDEEMLLGVKIDKGTPVRVHGADQLQYVWTGVWADPWAKRFASGLSPSSSPSNLMRGLVVAAFMTISILVVWQLRQKMI